MKVLIIGSGGREHALAWKLKQSSHVTEIFVAPGNGATKSEAINIDIKDNDVDGLVAFALENKIDLVIPGPELPLSLGVVDAMSAKGIACFGPDKWCAQLEASKSFAKDIMLKAGVPTAKAEVFTDYDSAYDYVKKEGAPIVIKADGLAAGKGVVVAMTEDEAIEALKDIMLDKKLGTAGVKVLIEEFMIGEEVSLICFCDGENALALPSAQDHKAIFEDDKGPNTGGMGAYSPAPVLLDDEITKATEITVLPILKEMAKQGHPFSGILYAGLMITKDGPKVVEYNVRFGDPECQPLLMRLNSDLYELIMAALAKKLHLVKLDISPKSALGVVLSAKGYPADYEKGMEINGISEANELEDSKVFVAGAKFEDGKYYSTGGRILCVSALGEDLEKAKKNAYIALDKIKMDKGHYRRDIGDKGLKRIKNK